MSIRIALIGVSLAMSAASFAATGGAGRDSTAHAHLVITPTPDGVGRVKLTDDEWQKRLTPGQFTVMRKQGTEIAFTGKYWNNHSKGTYRCAACGLELFSSANKFDSGTGWPSFWQPLVANHVVTASDHSLGMERDEVSCARCGGHLGHVFDDGPAPTHLRYCMNSASLSFVPAK